MSTFTEKYNSHNDIKLSQLATAGDEAALECLYARYREMIRAKSNLYFIVGGDRDDLIQEGMIGLFHAIVEYRPDRGAAFETFAELCVERQMMSAIKSAGRLKHAPLNTSVPIGGHETGGEDGLRLEDTLADRYAYSPEEEVLLRDQILGIDRDSEKIFSKLEKAVWDQFKRGSSYTEIATGIGRSPKAIDNAIQRMKKKVEKYMELY